MEHDELRNVAECGALYQLLLASKVEIDGVLSEQNRPSIRPGIRLPISNIDMLSWPLQIISSCEQEIAVKGQRIRDRTDQERLHLAEIWY